MATLVENRRISFFRLLAIRTAADAAIMQDLASNPGDDAFTGEAWDDLCESLTEVHQIEKAALASMQSLFSEE